MRVVHVVRQFAPSIGGLEDVVLNLARHQRASFGIDATVVTLDRVFARPDEALPASDTVDGVPVRRIPWRGSTRYPIAPRVLRHIRGADLVQVHAVDFFADFLALTRPLHRCPLVLATHGGIFHTAQQARLKRLWFGTVTRASLRAFDAVVAVSANDAALFAPLRPRRLVTIENGAALGKLRLPQGAEPMRDPRRLFFLGRFTAHKRIRALFPLLAALNRREPGWSLTVAGVEGDETEAGLRESAAASGVAAAVRFVIGAPDSTLAAEAARATFFACASAFEGFGVAAVEAAAAGLVPLLSRIPPFERLAARLPHALLFDADEPDAAADTLLAAAPILQNAPAATRAALAASVAPYGWEHVAGEYAALYRSLLPETA